MDLEGLFRDVPPGRRCYGVVGYPIPYTLSPALHTAALESQGVDAVYRKIVVSPEDWPDFLRGADRLAGFNVTIPHKERARVFGDGGFVGAVNTVYRKNGQWAAANTDVDGFWNDWGEQGIRADGRTVAVLGAGGAARAVLAAFHRHGARPKHLFLMNRTPEKAAVLAAETRRQGFSFPVTATDSGAEEILKSADVLINTTPQGQKAGDLSPVPPECLRPGQDIYDLIYHWETPLMAAARARGGRAVGGLGMLVHQAALAFDLWFGDDLRNKNVKYALEDVRAVMRQAAERALKEKETL